MPFYTCLKSKLVSHNFGQCPKKCAPISYSDLTHFIPLCETSAQFKCAMNITIEILRNVTTTRECVKKCNIIDYSEVSRWEDDTNENPFEAKFYIQISNSEMKVYEEYLIYDAIGMLSTVGGTLGLFVGFSVNNIFKFAIRNLQNIVSRYISK